MSKKGTNKTEASSTKKAATPKSQDTPKPKTNPTTGVIIAALDSPYYGNYAFQLALSVKHTSPGLQVALLCNDKGKGHLTQDKLNIFDKIIKVNDVAVTSNGRPATLKFKTYLYQISPFDNTLFLDADTLILPKNNLLNMIAEIPKDCNFTMQNRGFIDLAKATKEQLNQRFIVWANSLHIKEKYNFEEGKLYNLSSELIFFRKSKEVEALFKTAQKEYDNIKVNFESFNGGVPDELPFSIAMIKEGIYPHLDAWRPFYWEAFDKKRLLKKPRELYDQYYGVSFGGNFQENFIKKFYQDLARVYANAFAVQYVFPLKDKRSFLANRHTI